MDWAERDDQHAMCWLSGPAGHGKTTIAHTIADGLRVKLAGSFFFSRRNGRRSDATGLVPTLAYQLAVHQPLLRTVIEDTLRTDSSILSQTLENQFRKLIIDPILSIKKPSPMIIVLDALDECGDGDSSMQLVKLLADELTTHQLPFRFLLTSRPVLSVQNAFAQPRARSKTYALALQDFPPRDNIRAYLGCMFAEIFQHQEVFFRGTQRPWPSPAVLEEVVDKSEGLFIYVSTLIKYVGQGPGLPQQKLEAVRRIHAGLDPLYKHILSAALQSPNARRVIQTLVLSRRLLKIKEMVQLLELTPAEIRGALQGCHSLLVIPDTDEETIRYYHASLQDFLMDHNRSQECFVGVGESEYAGDGV
jgi:hypothetical protein